MNLIWSQTKSDNEQKRGNKIKLPKYTEKFFHTRGLNNSSFPPLRAQENSEKVTSDIRIYHVILNDLLHLHI